jgi:hypothetical protein
MDVSGVPSEPVTFVAFLLAAAIWGLEVWLYGYPRLSFLVLEMFAAISAAGYIVEMRNWRRWPAWELMSWSFWEQARLYKSATPGLGARLEPLVQQATADPATWSEIRALAAGADSPMRERVLAWADLMEGLPLDLSQYRSAVAAIEDERERRYWAAGLAQVESFAAYLSRGDYLQPLRDAQARLGPLHPPIRARLRRYGLYAIPLIVGLAVTVPVAIIWGN